MADFKLLSYVSDAGPRAGLLVGGLVTDIGAELEARLPGSHDMLVLLRNWTTVLPLLGELAASGGRRTRLTLDKLRLAAPVPVPNIYFCAGTNYYDHAREMRPGNEIVKADVEPYFFMKPGLHTTIGPHEAIRLPAFSEQVDWEIELGAVIGTGGRNLTMENALESVAGYTILNDLSARDHIFRKDWPFAFDWLSQKAFEGSMAMGPWITPAEQMPDLTDIPLKLWRNSELMQDSSTANMIFNVAEQIVYISRRVGLRPGDIIATGTPAGVGRPRGIFLRAGDHVRVEIPGIGAMEQRVEAGD